MMLRNLVLSALKAPDAGERFEDRIFELAGRQGVDVRAEDVASLEDLGERYVNETLRLLEACVTAAGQAHAGDLMKPVIAACESFFLRPDPSIEDPRGLIGLIASCYAVRALLAAASERTRGVRGFPLLAADPNAGAEIVVGLIGPAPAAALDRVVEASVATPALRFALMSARGLAGSLRASGRLSEWDPRWEDVTRAAAEEIGLRFDDDELDRPDDGRRDAGA